MKLSLDNIEKSYDKKIIKNLSYEFQSGKLYVVKGVSGCGKSTLLNIMGGVETEFGGTIQIDGEVCSSQKMLSLTGYVFQYSLLLSNITLRENLQLIHDDQEKIERLCEIFHVKELLQKYPDQVSGGERQRISIIRALLQNPCILLMDEPTASLDGANARIIAETVANLKSEDRIVIVATHESCMDELADEILYLDYGEISQIYKRVETEVKYSGKIDCILQEDRKRKQKTNFLRYNWKRNPQLFRFFSLLPYAAMFLLLAFMSTIQNNFEDEYMKMVQKNYPVEAFNIYGFELDEFVYKEDVILYERYIIVENDRTAYYLAPKEESVLAIEGMIEFGNFPENDGEILINRELALDLYGEKADFRTVIGDSIFFSDKEFVIAGVLFSFDEMERGEQANGRFMSYLYSDIYYNNIDGKILFIPYETIKTMGDPIETDVKRGIYRGLYNDKQIVKNLREALVSGQINIFDSEILSSKRELNGTIKILMLVVYVCFVMACIFMSTQIQTELFYRRKELGYLQIFGLKKSRVRRLVFSGYFWMIMVALVASLVIYGMVYFSYGIAMQSVLIFEAKQIGMLLGGMLVFYLGFAYASICVFLRRDIVRLITE